MQHYTNSRRSKQRKTRHFLNIMANTALLLIIIFALIITIIYQLSPQAADSPLLLIPLGIISTAIGIYAGNYLTKLPIPHDTLDSALKGFPKDHALYHHWFPATHVLVTPHTLFTLTLRSQDATVTFSSDSLTIHDRLLKRLPRFLVQNSLGDPLHDAHRDAQKLEIWLSDTLPNQAITIQPLIIFTNPNATITLKDLPPIPVLHADKRKPSLKAFIKAYTPPSQPDPPLTIATINTALGITQEDAN